MAQRLGLPNRRQVYELERDDGGPPLLLFEGGSRFTKRYGAEPAWTMQLDDQGFCNPEPNSYRLPTIAILAVGDSFTWCQSLPPESTWSSELARRLDLPVYNLGRGGTGPYEYLQLLKKFGLRKRPRLVVLNLFEGNDLRDSERYELHVRGESRAGASRPVSASLHLDGWLLETSYLYNLVGAVLTPSRWVAPKRSAYSSINFRYRLDFGGRSVRFNTQNTDRDEAAAARALLDGTIRMELLDPALEAFVRLAQDNDFVPVVSLSPSAHTAYSEFVRFEDPSIAEGLRNYSEALRSHLSSRSRELGFHYVDETPELQAAARALGPENLLYFDSNLHFTAVGHERVGRLLARELAPLLAASR